MRKPGEKGAPTPAGIKSAQEAVRASGDSLIINTARHGKVRYAGIRTTAHKETGTEERREIQYLKRNVNNLPTSARYQDLQPRTDQQQIKKKIIDESNNKPYVKTFQQNNSTQQYGWKASNKHGKVKYFGADFKASALKHAGIDEDTSADREVGTKSLVKKYKKETPGQKKADINEIFNAAFVEEVRSAEVKGEIVPGYTTTKVDPKTGEQKVVNVQSHITKGKVRRKIIGSGNVHDGAV
jgi:hypothetical protein